MTEENYRYRTSQLLLRNQFEGSGAWKIPVIPKAEFDEEEFRGLRLIGFDKTKLEDKRHLGRIVPIVWLSFLCQAEVLCGLAQPNFERPFDQKAKNFI